MELNFLLGCLCFLLGYTAGASALIILMYLTAGASPGRHPCSKFRKFFFFLKKVPLSRLCCRLCRRLSRFCFFLGHTTDTRHFVIVMHLTASTNPSTGSRRSRCCTLYDGCFFYRRSLFVADCMHIFHKFTKGIQNPGANPSNYRAYKYRKETVQYEIFICTHTYYTRNYRTNCFYDKNPLCPFLNFSANTFVQISKHKYTP